MKNNIRNLILLIIFILLAICLVLSASYAYYIIIPENATYEQEIAASLPNCTMVNIVDKSKVDLSGDYALPVKDNRLLNSSEAVLSHYKYSFMVTNTCDTSAEITLAFAVIEGSDMPINAVKYLLLEENEEIPKLGRFLNEEEIRPTSALIMEIKNQYNDEINKLYKLKTVTIPASSTINYDAYFWIDFNEGDITGNSNNITMNKTFLGRVIAAKYEILGSNIAFCEQNNIESFSECLIRSDSEKTLIDADKIIDSRTAQIDLNNLEYAEPSQLYGVKTEEVSNALSLNKLPIMYYAEINLDILNKLANGEPFSHNLVFDNKKGLFSFDNPKKGSFDDIVTTDDDIKNDKYKITTLMSAKSENGFVYLIKKDNANNYTAIKYTSVELGLTASMPGLYKVKDKYTSNNQNYSYVYRGEILKNWVMFGTETVWLGYNNSNGEGVPREYKTEDLCKNSTSSYKYNCTPVEADIYWRIVRINGNGSIRMIYSGNNLEEKVSSIKALHYKNSYTGILTNYNKGGNSRTSAFQIGEGVDPTYLGYMYNPNLELSSYPDYELKNPNNTSNMNLGSFPLSDNIIVAYFFDDFDITKNCDNDTKTCTFVCSNYNSSTKKGDNCIYTDWNALSNDDSNFTSDTAYGSTTARDYYTGKYRYACVNGTYENKNGNVYATCENVIQIMGISKSSKIMVLKKYGYFSSSYENALKNLADSQAKKEIDEWYSINFSNKEYKGIIIDSYLSDEGFCNDRSLQSGDGYRENTFYNVANRLYYNRKPTLICPNPVTDEFTISKENGNGALTYPVGMLTADEVALAGNAYRIKNSKNYLYASQAHTLTPTRYYITYLSSTILSSSLGLNVWSKPVDHYLLRPVINLSQNIKYEKGSGLRTDPYIVKLN